MQELEARRDEEATEKETTAVVEATRKKWELVLGQVTLCVWQIQKPKTFQHQQKNYCFKIQVWDFKKVKFDIKAEEVTVYNQLTRGSKSDRNSTEELAGYSKLQKCEGIEVLSNELHTKLQRFRTFRLPSVNQKS